MQYKSFDGPCPAIITFLKAIERVIFDDRLSILVAIVTTNPTCVDAIFLRFLLSTPQTKGFCSVKPC